MSRSIVERETSNPVFNDRKLKLGTFCLNLEGACAATSLDGVFHVNWPDSLKLAKLGDEMGFEALVPAARWKGYGGPTNFQGEGYECFSWASGMGASTSYSSVFSTSHITTIHPIMAAKQSVTVDHITGGRFVLNVVTGWNRPEIEMFGSGFLDHEDRYDCAEEWLTIVKRLWTEEDDVDFDGKFFRIVKGTVRPQPLQAPLPPIMNAGGSERGRHFAAKNADVAFVVFHQHDPDSCRAHIASYRDLAREEYGRDIQVWTNTYVVQGETEKEAQEYYDLYVNQKGDWEAAQGIVTTMGLNAKTIPPEHMQGMKAHFIAGMGGFPLIGTKEQIVDQMAALADYGLNGVLLSWPRFDADMQLFRETTLPLLEQAGLR